MCFPSETLTAAFVPPRSYSVSLYLLALFSFSFVVPSVVSPESVRVCHTCSSGLPNRMRNWIQGLMSSYVPHLLLLYLKGRKHKWKRPDRFKQVEACIIRTRKVVKLQKQMETVIVLTALMATTVFILAKMVALPAVTWNHFKTQETPRYLNNFYRSTVSYFGLARCQWSCGTLVWSRRGILALTFSLMVRPLRP